MTAPRPETTDDGQWREHAACRGMDPNDWFPTQGEPTEHLKAICMGCPSRLPCLDDALAMPLTIDLGIRGGLSERQRAALRRRADVRALIPVRVAHGTDEAWRGGCRCGSCTVAHRAVQAGWANVASHQLWQETNREKTAERQRAYRARKRAKLAGQ